MLSAALQLHVLVVPPALVELDRLLDVCASRVQMASVLRLSPLDTCQRLVCKFLETLAETREFQLGAESAAVLYELEVRWRPSSRLRGIGT